MGSEEATKRVPHPDEAQCEIRLWQPVLYDSPKFARLKMVLIDPMARNTPTEKHADTEYLANTGRYNLKGTRFRRGILKAVAKTEDLDNLGLLKTLWTAQIG